MAAKLLDVGYHIEYWDIEVNHLRFALVKGFGKRPYMNSEKGAINVIVIKDEDREKITISDRSVLNVCNPKGDGVYRHYPFWKGPENVSIRMVSKEWMQERIPVSVEDLTPKLIYEASVDALMDRMFKNKSEPFL